ncbi:S26 family signal peptidase [Shinella sp. M31]|uniref:S26 family signal peptidase n=1 Tax=Shinella sp. M31 TaxID=3368615 RepID=UPI003BA0DF87
MGRLKSFARKIAFCAAIIVLTPPIVLLGLAVLTSAPYVAALAIRSFVFQPFTVPANSMYPTLEAGGYIVTSKTAYGYKKFSVTFDLGPSPRSLSCSAATGRRRYLSVSTRPEH